MLAADHVIQNTSAFIDAVQHAQELASHNKLVTFGIKPTAPETGYGYIKASESNTLFAQVEQFVEKPDLATAQDYLIQGNYFWNSGMFMFKASTYS